MTKTLAKVSSYQPEEDPLVKCVVDIILVIINVFKFILNVLNVPRSDEGEAINDYTEANNQTLTITATLETTSDAANAKEHEEEKCTCDQQPTSPKIEQKTSDQISETPSTESRLKSSLKATPTAVSNKKQQKSVRFSAEKSSVKYFFPTELYDSMTISLQKSNVSLPVVELPLIYSIGKSTSSSPIITSQTARTQMEITSLSPTTEQDKLTTSQLQARSGRRNHIETSQSAKLKYEMYGIELMHQMLTMHKSPPPPLSHTRRQLQY